MMAIQVRIYGGRRIVYDCPDEVVHFARTFPAYSFCYHDGVIKVFERERCANCGERRDKPQAKHVSSYSHNSNPRRPIRKEAVCERSRQRGLLSWPPLALFGRGMR